MKGRLKIRTMGEPLQTGHNFCSELSRKTRKIKGKRIGVISKRARNHLEKNLLKNETFFYSFLLPIYNVLNKLHFSGKKLCPSFFDSTKNELFLEDLKKYKTKEDFALAEALNILQVLSVFHAIGFYLKQFINHQKQSQRIRGTKLWSTFTHGDCWSRNFMLCGKNRVKLIDFGFFDYNHCLKDISYFLLTSTDSLHTPKLSEYYKEHLQYNLRKIGVEFDTSNFYNELWTSAMKILPLATHVIKSVRKGKSKKNQLVNSDLIIAQLKWLHHKE